MNFEESSIKFSSLPDKIKNLVPEPEFGEKDIKNVTVKNI
jgi:hypothetical protein